jgi:hypothetical protein
MATSAVTMAAHARAFALVLCAGFGGLGLLLGCGSDTKADSDAGTGGGGGSTPFVVDGGGTRAVPPDGGALCATGECNYQTQQGCAAQQSCLPALDSGKVVPRCQAAGARTHGQSCTDWTDCAAGLFCAEGACRKMCCGGDWSACPSGESCIRQLQIRDPATSAAVPAGVDLCFPVGGCDVLDPQSCSETSNRSCQIVDPVGNVACAPSGDVAIGQPCSADRTCGAGASCVGDKCRRLCAAVPGLTKPPCPSAEGTCVHFVRDPPGVGECSVF